MLRVPPNQPLTVLELRVAELELPADARGALGGAQGPPQPLHVAAQGAERRVNLLQPLGAAGGALLLPPGPFGRSPVPPARGQRLQQLGRGALDRWGERQVGGKEDIRAPPREGTE